MKHFLRIFIWACFGLGPITLVAAADDLSSRAMARVVANSPLFSGPGENFPKVVDAVKVGDPVAILGVSIGQLWYRVMKANGYEGWVPKNRIVKQKLAEREENALQDMLVLKRRLTSRWILTAGPTFGSRPLAVGFVFLPFLNLARRGLLSRKTDQIEAGMGFGYHFYDRKNFFEIPIAVQWIFRPVSSSHFMLGPRVGFTIMTDPYFNHQAALPFEGGLHMRYFFDDDWGLYADALIVARSVRYYMGSLGAVVRF